MSPAAGVVALGSSGKVEGHFDPPAGKGREQHHHDKVALFGALTRPPERDAAWSRTASQSVSLRPELISTVPWL